MRSVRDQGERVQIDLIDVDPEVFTDDTHQQAGGRWRSVVTTVAVLGAMTGAAVVWWPEAKPPEWRVFHTAPVPAAGLTDELVFDQPPGPLVGTQLAPPPVDIKPALGYVFGEPGSSLLTRRWATFRTRSTNDEDAALAAAGEPQVDGVPAEVRRVRVRHEVTWGPITGRTWVVTTNMLNEEQSLDFAEHVGVVDGDPALAYQYQLAGMQPVGSVAAMDCVELLADLFRGERGRGAAQPTLLTWGSLDESVSLGSVAAPADALPLVEFVLGEGRAITIHGVEATVISSRVLSGPVVAWLEEGRLVMVAGHATEEELIALAESVRPATEVEWSAVALADAAANNDSTPITFGDATPLYQQVDPATGDVLAVTVQVIASDGSGELMQLCVQQRSEVGTSHCETSVVDLPLLTTIESNGNKFVVAVVGHDVTGSEVRVKLADGAWSLSVQDFGSAVPGLAIAMLLPEDYGVIELWANGEVIAAI